MTEERFSFTSKAKRTLLILAVVGVVLTALGSIITMSGGHHEEGTEGEGHALKATTEHSMLASANNQEEHGSAAVEEHESEGHGEGHHGSAPWVKRLFSNLWVNNIYFTGLAIIGLVFVAIQYAAQAGWSAGVKRIPLAMAHWIPIAGVLMIISWFVVKADIFHWTHASLYAEEGGDALIKGKAGFWYWPMEKGTFPFFYVLRLVGFFGLWYMFFLWIKKEMLSEDIDGDVKHWYKARKLSTIFLVIFGFSSSIAAWDWVMSIDPHWKSTLFGWYIFASWWVNGLAAITLIVVVLKQNGYLKNIVNANHLHDLGKFVFAFSIFWTYLWFAQFLLIYYANIPEESVYFVQRISNSQYSWVFYLNLILNFVLPFLLLMTRDAKRHMAILKLVCPIIIVGHWLDFYLMVTPGVMKFEGGFGFMEIGMALFFFAAFLYITLHSLTKAPLYAKNHPMLEESLHHHI